MKLVNFYYLDKETKQDKEVLNYFVASTKEENNIVDKLKAEHKYAESEVVKKTIKDEKGKEKQIELDKIYLTREDANEIAILISKKLGYESNESLINYVLNKFEVICLLQREKQEEEKQN